MLGTLYVCKWTLRTKCVSRVSTHDTSVHLNLALTVSRVRGHALTKSLILNVESLKIQFVYVINRRMTIGTANTPMLGSISERVADIRLNGRCVRGCSAIVRTLISYWPASLDSVFVLLCLSRFLSTTSNGLLSTTTGSCQ